MTSGNPPVSVIIIIIPPLLLFLLTISSRVLALSQPPLRSHKITLYSENCCKGRNETFTKDSRNLEEISDIVASGRMKSFSVHRGLWLLFTNPNYTGALIHQEGNDDEAHGNCGSSNTGSGSYTLYKSMRSIGNPFVDLPGLSLFAENNFQGDELYFDGKELKLSRVFKWKSFAFTGRDSWTLSPSKSSNANTSICLNSQKKTVSLGDGMDGKNVSRSVRLIRRGCVKPNGRTDKHLQVQHSLKLFTKQNKIGEEIMTDGSELRLPSPTKIESYSYIGSKNWTIYAGVKLDGDSECLVNVKDGSSGNEKIVVGSVKRGCRGDAVAEIITPPPEIQDRQTDTNGGIQAKPLFLFMTFAIFLG